MKSGGRQLTLRHVIFQGGVTAFHTATLDSDSKTRRGGVAIMSTARAQRGQAGVSTEREPKVDRRSIRDTQANPRRARCGIDISRPPLPPRTEACSVTTRQAAAPSLRKSRASSALEHRTHRSARSDVNVLDASGGGWIFWQWRFQGATVSAGRTASS